MTTEPATVAAAADDVCVFCRGTKGGVPGNENVIGGLTVCDYCSLDAMKLAAGPVVPEEVRKAFETLDLPCNRPECDMPICVIGRWFLRLGGPKP